MAYTVNKTNSSASPNQYTVQDGVVNSQTDLSLIGKGYAGYGEVIGENFLHLLENFANTSAPSKPIQGQLWYDSSSNKLKVYNGTSFQTAGGSAPYQSSAPAGLSQGDIWIDSDTGQLYFYNGTSSILVGPPATTGTQNGFTFDSILDSTDTTQNITKLFNDGNLIAIISEDAFTPKTSITGFATIKKGITLTNDIADIKFQGTATDSDALGGVAAANYLRSNANDVTSGTMTVANDGGIILGADSDLSVTVDSSGAIISNSVVDTDITFKVNDGGSTTTLMTLDGSESRVGIGTATPFTRAVVGGGSGTEVLTIFSGSSGEGQIRFADATSGTGSYQGRVEYDHSAGKLNLGAGGTTPFTIDSDGKVGIGTASPAGIHSLARVLEISGGDGGDLIIGNNSSSNIGAGAHIGAIAFKNIDSSTSFIIIII